MIKPDSVKPVRLIKTYLFGRVCYTAIQKSRDDGTTTSILQAALDSSLDEPTTFVVSPSHKHYVVGLLNCMIAGGHIANIRNLKILSERRPVLDGIKNIFVDHFVLENLMGYRRIATLSNPSRRYEWLHGRWEPEDSKINGREITFAVVDECDTVVMPDSKPVSLKDRLIPVEVTTASDYSDWLNETKNL